MAEPGRRLLGGRYELVTLLATGGQGQVWRARDTVLSRQVAVKVPATEASSLPVGAALTFVVGGQKYPLKVSQNAGAPVSGSVPLVARFVETTPPALGAVGSVVYNAKVATGVLVPSTALQVDGDQTYVFTIEGGQAQQRGRGRPRRHQGGQTRRVGALGQHGGQHAQVSHQPHGAARVGGGARSGSRPGSPSVAARSRRAAGSAVSAVSVIPAVPALLSGFGGLLAPMRASTQRALGSQSTRIALISSVAGIASRAPSGPRIQAQNSSATKVMTVESPTASPVKCGWMSDCTTALSRQ